MYLKFEDIPKTVPRRAFRALNYIQENKIN